MSSIELTNATVINCAKKGLSELQGKLDAINASKPEPPEKPTSFLGRMFYAPPRAWSPYRLDLRFWSADRNRIVKKMLKLERLKLAAKVNETDFMRVDTEDVALLEHS